MHVTPSEDDPIFDAAGRIWRAVRANFPEWATEEQLRQVSAVTQSVVDGLFASGGMRPVLVARDLVEELSDWSPRVRMRIRKRTDGVLIFEAMRVEEDQ